MMNRDEFFFPGTSVPPLSPIQKATKGILRAEEDSEKGGEVIAFTRVTKAATEQLRRVLVDELGLEEGYQNPTKEKTKAWFYENFVSVASITVLESRGDAVIISFWREKGDRVWIMNTFVEADSDSYTPLSEEEGKSLSAKARTCTTPNDKYCGCATCVEMKSTELDLRGKNGAFQRAELIAHLTGTPYNPDDDRTDPREIDEWVE
jgi:hypothetical protein